MSWFKVDDGFIDHPKLEALEGDPEAYKDALIVWFVMGVDCARRSADGRVTRARLQKVLGFLKNSAIEGAETLVEVGLWERTKDGYLFHDWADYQPTKAEVLKARKLRNKRQRKWRKNVDAHVDDLQPRLQDDLPTRLRTESCRRSTDATHGSTRVDPGPSRPDPDQEIPPTPQGAGAIRCATNSESGRTVRLVADAVRTEARVRHLEPAPLVPRSTLEQAAARVDALVQDGVVPDAQTGATALVHAAFSLGQQRPLRFALLEATVSGPNGQSAQSRHKPPEDPWV